MDYISITEAITLTGKSISTIRRWVRKVAAEPDQTIVKKVPGVTSERYLISRDALLKEFSEPIPEPIQEPDQIDTHEPMHDQFMSILQEQLQRQSAQLEKKDEQIAQLLERLRETNILMNGYQNRLLTMQEPKTEPAHEEKEAGKKREPAWVAWLLIAILVTMLGLATYVSWGG